MLIAKIEKNEVVDIGEFSYIFPNTSFTDAGPSDEFIKLNGCMYVNSYIPFDPDTQKLVNCEPYIEKSDETHWVFNVKVQQLTPEEISQREEEKRQQNKAQAEKLLQETDWTENPSARNTAKTPHLVNGEAFDDYRVALRAIAVNPPVTVTEWPVKPDEVWS